MPVFDFSNEPASGTDAACTYTITRTSAPEASPQKPIVLLDNRTKAWKHHSWRIFCKSSAQDHI